MKSTKMPQEERNRKKKDLEKETNKRGTKKEKKKNCKKEVWDLNEIK